MRRVREGLLHICVVCSLVCVTAKILDWYNPYMDFTGHIWGIQLVLYLGIIVLGCIRKSSFDYEEFLKSGKRVKSFPKSIRFHY